MTQPGAWSGQSGSAVTSYAYDPAHRLVAVAPAGESPQTYGYDADGRRIRVTAGTTVTYFRYDGTGLVAEYSGRLTAPLARYTHGPGVDDPVLRIAAAGTQYYHSDGLGSIVALNNATGGLAAMVRYDAWGKVLAATGPLPCYGYTGREPDPDTGLIYYRARYYDPVRIRLPSASIRDAPTIVASAR